VGLAGVHLGPSRKIKAIDYKTYCQNLFGQLILTDKNNEIGSI
jgi:hypothetical protein